MEIIAELALALDINDDPTENPERAVSIRHWIQYADGTTEVTDTYLTQPDDEDEEIDNKEEEDVDNTKED